jgi:cell division protein ZapE
VRIHVDPPLYLWGGVGRGKTFLMDLFHDGLRGVPKLRLHFHRFMGRVHAELQTLKEQADPLVIVAERLASEARVLCFDEFFVSDIGDAMLLARLLEGLFARGHGAGDQFQHEPTCSTRTACSARASCRRSS